MQEVQKPTNPKCNIAQSALCKTDNLNCLLGWAEELETVRKQYQEADMRLTELQNKYRAAKKTASWYRLWVDGKERHIQQDGNGLWLVCTTFCRWCKVKHRQHLLTVQLLTVLLLTVQLLTAFTETAVTGSAVTDIAVTDSVVNDSAFIDSAVTGSAATDSAVAGSAVTDSEFSDIAATNSAVIGNSVTDNALTD